jgi:hypothetical protein
MIETKFFEKNEQKKDELKILSLDRREVKGIYDVGFALDSAGGSMDVSSNRSLPKK